MEEIKVSGIVVGGEDYREADRLVRILTPESGVISAVMRGVKKEKAKLKFASMPFAFCEFSLFRRGGYYTVKTAQTVESLFAVASDPSRYVAASVMLETAAYAAGSTDSAEIFLSLLTALKELIYSAVPPETRCLIFVTDLLARGGYILPSESAAVRARAESSEEPPETVAIRLKRVVRLFENKLICKVKSAQLL